MSEIQNAKIESTMLGWEDHGILTATVYLKLSGGGTQGFGGYALDQPMRVNEKFTGRQATEFGARFIEGVMRAVGVDQWEKLPGSYCRVEGSYTKIERIGHLLEDRWFNPDDLLRKDAGMKATDKQQLGFLIRDVLPALEAVTKGYDYNPGDSDLDNEQPIYVRMTLGDYRRASRLYHALTKDGGTA